MARIRTIKPDFWQHPKTASVSRDARLLFLGLLNEADDEGRMRYAAKRLAGVLFPFDEDVTPTLLESWVRELEAAGLAEMYAVDGHLYLGLPGFTEHQRISHAKPSTLPEKPRGTCAEEARTPRVLVMDPARGEGEQGTGNGNREVEVIAPKESARKPDVLWDALLRACGITGPISPSARGAYNKARSDLAACNATPDMVQERAGVYRMRWPNVSLTPTALARRWSECEPNPAHRQPDPVMDHIQRQRELEGRA